MSDIVFPRSCELSDPRAFLTLAPGSIVRWLHGRFDRGRFVVVGRTKDALMVDWLDYEVHRAGRWWLDVTDNDDLVRTVHHIAGAYCEVETRG